MTGNPPHQDSQAEDPGRARVRKSAEAFRTISEVADDLHVPQHVLRFWETKFPRIKPLKRGGGRRYYRPDDVILLRRIADLLYIQGYTIKGVQRLLKEGGGSLQDGIPPASAEERAASVAERAQSAPPAIINPHDDGPELPIGPARQSSSLAQSLSDGSNRVETALEQSRLAATKLRGALVSVLSELEALRASLDN